MGGSWLHGESEAGGGGGPGAPGVYILNLYVHSGDLHYRGFGQVISA